MSLTFYPMEQYSMLLQTTPEAFETDAGVALVVDPAVASLNIPSMGAQPGQLDAILLTRGEPNRLNNTLILAKAHQARVYANPVLCAYLQAQDPTLNCIAMVPGGQLCLPWGKLVMTPSVQVSTLPDGRDGGMAAGFLLYVCGHKLYFAGETGLGADIKFIGDYYKPNIAVLPTGGTTSLHPADIHRVVFWLGADIVIPTWAAKETPDNLDEIVTVIDHETSAICKQIPVGESWQLQSARPMERRSGPESGY